MYGYPSKALRLGTGFQPFPVTEYDLLYVFAQYDGVADFPDNPFNLLAVTNALMGGEQLHVDAAQFPILTQATYYNSTTNSDGGTTTIVMIPTTVLPILVPLQKAGASATTIANLDQILRPMIDRAYRRPPMTYGIIAPDVVPYPPGYTPPSTSTLTAATEPVTSALVPDTSPKPAPAPVAVPRTTDQAAGLAESISGRGARDGSASLRAATESTGGDGQRDQTTSSDSAKSQARTRSSAKAAGNHTAPRTFGHHKSD